MQAAGFVGTYYIVSGSVGTPNYVTMADLATLAAAGNEIGGHTVSHPDLTTVDADEAARQICLDRNTLLNWGYSPTSFAYPYASVDAQAEAAAQACGYNSARGLGDIKSRFGCSDCDYAESLTAPEDPFVLKALDEVEVTWTLQDLQDAVLNAENSHGGWVILTFHHFCEGGCDDGLGISPSLFAQFTSWLTDHIAQTPTTAVKTVGEVMGGTVKPAVTPPAPPATSGAMANASLETVGSTGLPVCWITSSYGTNTPTASMVSPGHTGSQAVELSVSTYTDGATQLIPQLDSGQCAPTAAEGVSYQVSAWYKGTGTAQFSLYYRNANGGFQYWTSGPYVPQSADWAQATFVTPPLPAGATGISFGLALLSVGDLTVDDFAIVDAASVPPVILPSAMDNPSLELIDQDGQPQCWAPAGFGANDGTAATTTDAHTGATAETVTITQYADGDIRLMPALYLPGCAPAVTPGATYTVSAWYTSTAITQFALYYLDASGAWQYWTSGEWLNAESSWTQASFVTPPVPAGATAISFGLSLFSVGTLTTDDYAMTQN